MNVVKTGLLLAALTGLFLAVGFMIGGTGGMVIAFVIAVAMNAFSYWNADKMVLRMHGAREVDRGSAPKLFSMVEDLSARAGLPMPRVYIMENDQPNAFATGRNPENAAVAATTGLLGLMNREEIAAVMAHELAHIKNRDTLIMTVTATIAGAISMLANFALFFGGNRNNPLGLVGTIAMMILAPLGAMLVQMAISRAREYEADRIGAEICGNPSWLASALAKLERGARRVRNQAAENSPATAHMFIVNPLSGEKMDNLFSTHPNTDNRIAALNAMDMPRQRTSFGGGDASAPPRPEPAPPAGPWSGTSGSAGSGARSSSGVPRVGSDDRRQGPWGS